MANVDVNEDPPKPRLVGTPAQVTIRLLINDQTVGEVTTERPNEVEARAYCRDLLAEIEALIHKGAGYPH